MTDQRNSVVRLALQVQALLDELNTGNYEQAAATAEEVAVHARIIAAELNPAEGEAQGPRPRQRKETP
jgi:hypothetical protein